VTVLGPESLAVYCDNGFSPVKFNTIYCNKYPCKLNVTISISNPGFYKCQIQDDGSSNKYWTPATGWVSHQQTYFNMTLLVVCTSCTTPTTLPTTTQVLLSTTASPSQAIVVPTTTPASDQTDQVPTTTPEPGQADQVPTTTPVSGGPPPAHIQMNDTAGQHNAL
jgi:hypothetical protein